MKERPILMTGAMVRASMRPGNPKTQTRRVAKFFDCDVAMQFPPRFEDGWWKAATDGYQCQCPYGVPGDRLWVRETWRANEKFDHLAPRELNPDECSLDWAASVGDLLRQHEAAPLTGRWRPSIHMPRWAARLELEIVDVRVERLQQISEEDAIAEGAKRNDAPGEKWDGSYLTQRYIDGIEGSQEDEPHGSAREWYRDMWKEIHGPGSWEANPWVWVIDFKRVPQP